MTIEIILKMERKKWGYLGIIKVIDDGVFVCTCNIFYDMTKIDTSHAFVYDSHSEQKEMIECCSANIDNKYLAPIFVLEEKGRKTKLQ